MKMEFMIPSGEPREDTTLLLPPNLSEHSMGFEIRRERSFKSRLTPSDCGKQQSPLEIQVIYLPNKVVGTK